MTTPAQKPPSIARTLLGAAFGPEDADRIFTDKVLHRPLFLSTTEPNPPSDARARRQQDRQKKRDLARRRATRKPKPLSAKEIRELKVYEVPKSAQKYEVYEGLHKLWIGYMHELLEGQVGPVTPNGVGPRLASAEYVGAEMEVVRCRCVSRVGVKGIVVKDTKFTFEIVTKKNELKVIPKEHAIFRFEVPPPGVAVNEGADGVPAKNLIFELHGSQFEQRSTDRANKKFKQHSLADL